MAVIEHALSSIKARGPAHAVAAIWLALSVGAPEVAAEQTLDAHEPAASAGDQVDSRPASRPNLALSHALASPSPARDGALLVASGEPVHDIDKIVESLDRRAPVSAVAFSPDGELIASASEDHFVRVWHIATRRLVRRLAGHSSAVTAVAFSPDGSTLASASNDRTVRLWDARTGRLLRTLQGHTYHVYAVAFAPQGQWLATASWDRTIQLWNVRSGALLKKLRGAGAAVRAIDVSPDGKTLASGSDDGMVRLWSAETGASLRAFEGHAGPVLAIRFRPDGEWLFSGSSDQTVRAWHLPDGATARKLGDCGAPVSAIAVSPNGQTLGAVCGGAGAVFWDVPTGAELRRSGGGTAKTRAIAFSRDGRMVATGSDDASILVRDVATGRELASLSANLAHLDAVAFGPERGMLAVASRDGRVLLWQDAGDHKALGRVLLAGPVRALAFSPDGRFLAAGGEDPKLAVWEVGRDGPPRRLDGHEGVVRAVAFAPDGRALVSAGDDATVRVWSLDRGGEAKVLKGHAAPVRALAVAPDGAVVASASDDQTARTWDLSTGRSLAVLRSHRAPVTSVAFSADGKLLVTGSQDRTVDVWLAARGRLLRTLRKELPSGVVALAILGQRIAVASSDGALGLWEIAGNRPVKQSAAASDAITALAVAPDGATLASASRDGVLRLWDGETIERRWSLAGSTRERWFACNDAKTCWRWEDGALLGRVGGQGDRLPVSPSDEAHRTTLAARIDDKGLGPGLVVVEGRTATARVRIDNRGAHPAYFVNLAQGARRSAGSGTSLVLIPPPTIPVLAPGGSVTVVCEVSGLGEYENPRPRTATLRLSITSASAEAVSLDLPVRVETPHLELRGLALVRGNGDAVVVSMTDVAMAQQEPVRLQGSLALEGKERASIAPIVFEQVLGGQDLALSFALPEGTRLGRQSRVTFTVHKGTHPAHVWTFPHLPVHIPIPLWLWALLFGGVLGLGVAIWQAGLYARARPLWRKGKRLARAALAALLGLARVLLALVFIRRTMRSLRERLRRGGIASTFFRLQPETQCSHLARQVGASWAPLAAGRGPVFELYLGPEVPLNVERCLLALPTDGDSLAAALDQLRATEEVPGTITMVLSDAPWSELAERFQPARRLVVLSKAAMNRILRAPRPALAFAQAISDHVDRGAVSLYRSAVCGGERQPFHGRKSELRRLAADPRGNSLVVGPEGIGKTSLLAEIHRRFQDQPTVECYYLSLADGDLTSVLGEALGMPDEGSLEALLGHLGERAKAKKVVVLCDDADTWATLDAASGGAEIEALARRSRDHRCSFVLAGFLGLLHATRARPGREQFGDLIRLECLDDESCAELATLPMTALHLHYARADLVELVAQQSGGMPGLLLAICDQVVAGLPPDQHTIDRAVVESACKCEAVARTITAWRPRFGLQEPHLAALDHTVMLSAVFKTRFTLHELASTLADLGVEATATEIEHSARRLVAACVFEHWLGHFHFRVPLFQTVMQGAALARMVAQSESAGVEPSA